ncbi:uncharacterized protein METZ01_LOCUS493062 [marine metagenome]|uniref:Uncharacterized protein n=1 Tax=marine metagenome TaxID=408172 RepID=A0A383D8M9_9ZZZZ
MDAASAIYVTPSELLDSNVQSDDRVRLGGQVLEGSIFRNKENKLELEFIVKEEDTQVPVKYSGATPDIFGDNAVVFVEGYYYYETNIFLADTLLTRHPDTMEPLSQEFINSDPNDSY